MESTSSRLVLRRPLALALLLAAVFVQFDWLEPVGEHESFSVGSLVVTVGPPVFAVLTAALLVGLVVGGGRVTLEAVQFALGRESGRTSPRTARVLRAMGDGALGAAFVVSLVAGLGTLAPRIDPSVPAPAQLAGLLFWLLFAPLAGLGLDRLLFAPAAVAAARHTGTDLPERSAQDLVPLLLCAVPPLIYVAALVPYDVA